MSTLRGDASGEKNEDSAQASAPLLPPGLIAGVLRSCGSRQHQGCVQQRDEQRPQWQLHAQQQHGDAEPSSW